MAQEELKLKDLCARLPYGVKGTVEIEVSTGEYSIESGHLIFVTKEIDVELLGINKDTEEIDVSPLNDNIDLSEYDYTIYDFIPYLRPISSMTEEEKQSYYKLMDNLHFADGSFYIPDIKDWLDEHHFDYSDLIDKGLALEAPEGMYNIKEKYL